MSSRPRSHVLLSARTALLVVALGLLALACGDRSLEGPPPELQGMWTPEGGRYAGRSLEIRPDAVVLGLGERVTERHPLETVLVRRLDDDARRFTLRYRAEDDFVESLVVLLRARPPHLRLAHRDEHWVRTGS